MCILTSFPKVKPSSIIDRSLSWVIALFVCLTFPSLSHTVFAQTNPDVTKVIIVGGDYHYPPYEFLDKNGNPTGYNVEVTKAIAEVMGIQVEVRLDTWNTMRQALENGEVDALQGMVFTDSRRGDFDFSPAHAIIHQSIFYRKGGRKPQNIESLKGKEVIVQKGGSMHDNFLELGLDINLILTDTHADALRLLASGKHDYAVVANLPGLYLGKKLKLTNLLTSGEPIKSFRYCYAVKKGNVELLALINEGLAIIKNTGMHQQIYDKWLSADEPREISWKRLIRVVLFFVVPLMLVMIGIMVWNWSLKKEVSIRTTEIAQQQQQLIQADKLSTLGILVSGVAHEINNPNSLILLNTPVIRDSFSDIESILDTYYKENGDFLIAGLEYSRMKTEIPLMIADMLSGANRIKRIVEDLKDYSRIEDSETKDTVNINEIVRKSIRLTDNAIKKHTTNFQCSYSEKLGEIYGSPQKIEQVIVNLIINACQSLDDTKRKVSIKTYPSEDKQHVVIAVIDEGKGIDPEHFSHLTDPFFTTKRNSGGTGLGLYVSANIVKDHHGTMVFTSNPKSGTTVRLSLPKAENG
jgi:signal transduction histidine kinase